MKAPPAGAAQRDFAAALLDPTLAPPMGLRAHNGSDVRVRFNVHRNNVRVTLAAALADTFPVLRELVGAEFFGAMAQVYVSAHPPRSPVLTHYGDGFADWVAAFPPAASLPYLADIARLERARVHAFHAADAHALSAADLARHLAAPQHLPQALLRLHPSLRVIDSRWAIVSLWAAHQGHGALAEVDPSRAEAALVLRVDDDAAVLGIDTEAAGFYRRLQQGQPLGRAAAAASGGFDLTASLALLIRHGAICAWHDDGDNP